MKKGARVTKALPPSKNSKTGRCYGSLVSTLRRLQPGAQFTSEILEHLRNRENAKAAIHWFCRRGEAVLLKRGRGGMNAQRAVFLKLPSNA